MHMSSVWFLRKFKKKKEQFWSSFWVYDIWVPDVVAGYEGESNNNGLFDAWDDRIWAAQEDQG